MTDDLTTRATSAAERSRTTKPPWGAHAFSRSCETGRHRWCPRVALIGKKRIPCECACHYETARAVQMRLDLKRD